MLGRTEVWTSMLDTLTGLSRDADQIRGRQPIHSVSQQNDGHLQSTESKLVVAWLAALLETEIHTMSRTCQLVVVPACWRPDLS